MKKNTEALADKHEISVSEYVRYLIQREVEKESQGDKDNTKRFRVV